MMIEYNQRLDGSSKGEESKQQARYKAPGKGLKSPQHKGWGLVAQRHTKTQTRTEGDNARTKECIV